MFYRISSEAGFLRADLFHRETAEEAREFFGAVADTALRRPHSSILISVHSSSPLFTVDRSGILTQFTSLGADPQHKIALVADSDAFAQCLTEKLLTYALGRGLERYDKPTVKTIARRVAAGNYRFSNLILEIVNSLPFQMRKGDRGKS